MGKRNAYSPITFAIFLLSHEFQLEQDVTRFNQVLPRQNNQNCQYDARKYVLAQ